MPTHTPSGPLSLAAAAPDRFTTVTHLRGAIREGTLSAEEEADALASYLDYDTGTEEEHIADIRHGIEVFFETVERPSTEARQWYGKIWPTRPMMSLRDVEEQVTVHLRREE